MRILQFGEKGKRTLMLIHGFQSPYQMWNKYIEHFKENFHVLVPILPGHDPENIEELVSFGECSAQVEDFLAREEIKQIDYIYSISIGGILAASLMIRQQVKIGEIIFESSPLMGFGSVMTRMLKRQYLGITQEARKRDPKTLAQASDSIVTNDNLEKFIEVLQKMPDKTIIKYLDELHDFRMPEQINGTTPKIVYCYGSGLVESFFGKAAKFLKKNYDQVDILKLPVKGHCTDALLHPDKKIEELDYLIL